LLRFAPVSDIVLSALVIAEFAIPPANRPDPG
jgi:hypothetical protein